MAIYPGALYRPLDRYSADAKTPPPGMVSYDRITLHTAVTDASSLFGYFNRVHDTSHFYVSETGEVEQYVDTMYAAAADREGNPRNISIETHDGYPRLWTTSPNIPEWNQAQFNALVALLRWISETHDIPLTALRNSLPGGTGVGYHRLGVDPWRISGGESWSSSTGKACPGDARILQIPDLIRVAKGSDPVPTPPAQKYDADYVKEIQKLLNITGASLLVDGILGPITKSAVLKFQRDNGLHEDADPGPITYATLKSVTSTSKTQDDKDMARTTSTYVNPFRGRITSRYNRTRRHPVTGRVTPHLGTDIAPPTAGTRGLPIGAFAAGTVVAAGWNILSGRTGNGVLIEHSGGVRTYYGHLASVSVSRGQTVSPGQRIGICGATGQVTGIHLHFEVHLRRSGSWVTTDPQPYARGRGVTLGSGGTAPAASSYVRDYQRLLNQAGFYKGLIDGIAGPVTLSAVRAFQRQYKLHVDGVVGPITLKKLKDVTKGSKKKSGGSSPAPKKPSTGGTSTNRAIQTALRTAGYYSGAIDGINGPMQKAAVSAYQRAQKYPRLVADGHWGPVTQRHYDWTKRLQNALNKWKAVSPKLRVDGDLGAATQRGVRQFQQRNRSVYKGAVDGVPGPVTARALKISKHPSV